MKETIKQMLKNQLWDELHPELDTISFELAFDRIHSNIKAGKEVYPPPGEMFSAYNYVDPKDIKVVIIGQDPYHNGQANGMAFAVNKKPIPPSLRNIYKELCDEFDHRPDMDEFDFSLKHWAEQGVLLLNTSFTVVEKQPGSHRGLWDFILHPTFRLIKWNSPKAIHVLWGKHAQGYTKYIDGAVLQAAHPAAEAYGNAGFFGCGHFYQINERLKARGEKPIDWFKLPEPVSEQSQIDDYDEEVNK